MSSDNYSSDPVRLELLKAVERAPNTTNLKQLSIDLGYNHAYLHQFIYRGSPRVLPEQTRYQLAKMLNIPDHKLSHSPQPHPRAKKPSKTHQDIAYLDHISQSRLLDQHWMVPREFLTSISDPNAIKLIALSSDDSNIVMIDTHDRSPLLAGEFALDMESNIRIRHLEQISPDDDRLHITGNDSTPYISTIGEQRILGRVIFKGALFTTSSRAQTRASS